MTSFQLTDIDPEEIDDLLEKAAVSFQIKFSHNELASIRTFGELCDHITHKIPLTHTEDCSSQQAFYKLREAFQGALKLDKNAITPASKLAALIPRRNRKLTFRKLEAHLAFKLGVLQPPAWAEGVLAVTFLASLVAFFISWQLALFGLAFSIIGFKVAYALGKELAVETVGQLAEKITREHYLSSRRNQTSVNKKEIEKVLTDWFSQELGIAKENLTRDAKLVA